MPPLTPDTCFHIYNHANGFENVFRIEGNFNYFLEKYSLYISPIAETYAFCLMPNHFHFAIRIRKKVVIESLIRNNNTNKIKTSSKVSNFGRGFTDNEIEKYLSKQFANLFSCYTQSFNKVYHRMGSLFVKNFKRDPITDKKHFLNVIVYVHRNPIHHGFCKQFDEWEHCSYHNIVDGVSDLIEINKLLIMTSGIENFKKLHQLSLDNNYFSSEIEI